MIRGAGAQATSGVAREAALELCASGASALDAVVGGWLALATTTDVLLAPLVILVLGTGAPGEGRAYDGRALVGGKQGKRPRGVLAESDAPAVARAAVPRSLGAVSLALGYFGRTSLSVLASRAARALEKASLPERAAVVEAFGARGAGALPLFAADVLRAAGSGAGGPLTEADLDGARPAEAAGCARGAWFEVPFERCARGARTELVLAADGRGLVAALAVSVEAGRVLVPELGCALPGGAPPVLRGSPRPVPGSELAIDALVACAHFDGSDLVVGAGAPSAQVALPNLSAGGLDALDGAFPGPWVGLLRTAQEARPLGRLTSRSG